MGLLAGQSKQICEQAPTRGGGEKAWKRRSQHAQTDVDPWSRMSKGGGDGGGRGGSAGVARACGMSEWREGREKEREESLRGRAHIPADDGAGPSPASSLSLSIHHSLPPASFSLRAQEVGAVPAIYTAARAQACRLARAGSNCVWMRRVGAAGRQAGRERMDAWMEGTAGGTQDILDISRTLPPLPPLLSSPRQHRSEAIDWFLQHYPHMAAGRSGANQFQQHRSNT